MPQQLALSTAGRHVPVALMLRATLRTPAVLVWKMVSLSHSDSLSSPWVLQSHWRWSLCVNDREVRQALVLHADRPSGSVRPLSLRDQRWILQRGKTRCFYRFPYTVSGPVSRPHTDFFFVFFSSPHRTACMTAATVRKVRIACVRQSPPTSIPVPLLESRSAAGGTPSVVSSE